jgi:hypothetical protein
VRGDREVERLVLDYIRSGAYPDWPYAGALWIEAEFQERGIDAVREWMHQLRGDPLTAASAFLTKFGRVEGSL